MTRKQLEDLRYRQALTLAEIATRLGTHPRRISQRAAELGLPIRKHPFDARRPVGRPVRAA